MATTTARGHTRSTGATARRRAVTSRDRKSTRLNSSHLVISYAVFCLKKKRSTDVIIAAGAFARLYFFYLPFPLIILVAAFAGLVAFRQGAHSSDPPDPSYPRVVPAAL